MRAFFDDQPVLRDDVAMLGQTDARLLWALRRLALMVPLGSARCQAAHIALQRDFGDAGLGVEHLLRCVLVGLARLADRRLAIGLPGCAVVTDDELALLGLVAGDDAAALVDLAGPAATRLMPLFAALRMLVRRD